MDFCLFVLLQIVLATATRVRDEDVLAADYGYVMPNHGLQEQGASSFEEDGEFHEIGDIVQSKLGETRLKVFINVPLNAYVDVDMGDRFPEVKNSGYYIACKVVPDTGTCGDEECKRLTANQFPFDKHCNTNSKYKKMVCCGKMQGWVEAGYYSSSSEPDKKQQVGDIVTGQAGKDELSVLLHVGQHSNGWAPVKMPELKGTNLGIECTTFRQKNIPAQTVCGDDECSRLSNENLKGLFPMDKHCNENSKYRQMVCCRAARRWEQVGDIVAGNRGESNLKVYINLPHKAFVDVNIDVSGTSSKIECTAIQDTHECGDAVCSAQTKGQFPIDKHCNTDSMYGKMVCCRVNTR